MTVPADGVADIVAVTLILRGDNRAIGKLRIIGLFTQCGHMEKVRLVSERPGGTEKSAVLTVWPPARVRPWIRSPSSLKSPCHVVARITPPKVS